jgi:hypothetical protein
MSSKPLNPKDRASSSKTALMSEPLKMSCSVWLVRKRLCAEDPNRCHELPDVAADPKA